MFVRFSHSARPWLGVWLLGVCAWVISFGALMSDARAEPPQKLTTGSELYGRYCKLCHGSDGTGYAADNAPSLVSRTFLASADDEFIARGIRLGRPNTAMAAYGESRGGPLDDKQIAAIVEFLRAKGPRAAPLPDVQVRGTAGRGSLVFKRHCQSCHGTSREPGKAPQLHNPEFLAAASPAFMRHAIVHGRPPTKMPAFEKRLSATQIDDVVAWLASLRRSPPLAPRTKPTVPDDLPLVIHPKGAPPDFTLREGRFVSAEQVRRALADKRRLIIIDARPPSDWLLFHIPGAVPISYYDTAKLERVPNDGTWVVAYCACPHHASGEVVDALRRRGYPHTAVLDEGILFWQRSGFELEGETVGGPRESR
jgi:cytochrome c oxidase cbb3-type subunit III